MNCNTVFWLGSVKPGKGDHTQSREWEPGVEDAEKDKLLGLAITIAKQDYSVIETEGRYVVGCKLLSDWIISRRSEWRVD